MIYVEDRRFQHDFRAKTCQEITVPIEPCGDSGYQVRIKDVLSQLQDGPAAIVTGPGMLLSRDLRTPPTNPCIS